MDNNHLLFVLCVIFIMDIKLYNSDIALKYFNSSVHKFIKMAPKAWQNYIRLFMFRYLNNTQLENIIFNNAIFNMYTYSMIFMDLKYKSLESRGLLQGSSPYKMNVSWTSGTIFISLHPYKYGSQLFQLYFYLNSEIRLNLTFILLHLRGVLLNCNFDKLEVKSLTKTKSRYKFCGYHSNFNLYPDMHEFYVIVSLQLMKQFDLDAIFSITDRQFISNPLNLSPYTKKLLFFIQLICYKIVRKYYLPSFHISIIKIYRLKIDIVKPKENNYVIYDGPGYRFDILNKYQEKSHFLASTFQCLLQFLLMFEFEWKTHDLFFYGLVYGNNNFLQKIHPGSGVIIQIPFIDCLSNFCVHSFHQPEGFSLNITVLNMKVSSPETSYCLFQGLNFGEIWEFPYSTIDELCAEFQTPSEASRTSYYTRRSLLYVVLYWYKGYTSITATVAVNATKCQAVYINICKYHKYCTNGTISNYNDYIHRTIHHTRLQLGDCTDYQNKLPFTLPPGECVFIVLFDKFDLLQTLHNYELLTTCEFTLSSRWGKNKIHYIDGFLDGKNYIEAVGHKDCFSSKYPMCNTVFNDKNVHEFHQLKFINKFKQYLTDEIDIISIKINSRESKNLVNIMLLGLSGRKEKKQYGLTAYQPGLKISDLMFRAALSTSWFLGLDWILSIDRNISLGPHHRNVVCSFTIERKFELIISSSIETLMVGVGKS